MDWDNMGVDWAAAYAKGQASKTAAASPAVATPAVVAAVKASTTPVAASSPSAAASSSSGSSSSSSSSSNNVVSALVGGIVGAANKLTSVGAAVSPSGALGDNYMGNYGSPYGSNVIKVDSVGTNTYTNTFKNTQSQTITVNIWNKVGPDMQVLSGSALAPKDTTLTFTLAPGASQVVAFQENSQVAWAQACSETTPSGAFKTTWGEANFVKSGSGYDVSAINNPNNDYAMTITSSEAPQCTSSRTENFWLTDSKPIGGSDGSCFIAQNTATLQTIMGGTV
jgi:hypothetical protein